MRHQPAPDEVGCSSTGPDGDAGIAQVIGGVPIG